MESGLQKRRSSWCDDEDLVWHPCRSWGGQNGVNLFPQIANFCLCCQLHSLWWFQRCHGNDPSLQCPDIFIDSSLQNLYILTSTFNTSTAIIRCYWNFFSCSFASTFALLMAMILLAAGVLRLGRSPVQRSCDPWLRRQRISIHGRGY